MFGFEVESGKITDNWLEKLLRGRYLNILAQFGERGVAALASTTPKETGETAAGWRYEVSSTINGYELSFVNDHVTDGVNIAIILQTGHGTGTGGYVAGRDYINPALRPLFDDMTDTLWRMIIHG